MEGAIWFLLFNVGMWLMLPIHYRSVEHRRLRDRYGAEKGRKFGGILGMISGWGFFIFLFGVWLSPQPRFTIPSLEDQLILIPLVSFAIPLINMIVFLPFLIVGAWFGIAGVRATGLTVAETHRPEKVISTGIYGAIRDPQYFGAIIAHVGISVLLSALYSLLVSPLIVLYNYLVARKEETELIRELGKQYEDYKRKVPMLRPKM